MLWLLVCAQKLGSRLIKTTACLLVMLYDCASSCVQSSYRCSHELDCCILTVRLHLQDLDAAVEVRPAEVYDPVKPPRPHQRAIEYILPVIPTFELNLCVHE